MILSKTSILLLALITAGVVAETETFSAKPRVDVGKGRIEAPLKKLVATTRTNTPRPAIAVAAGGVAKTGTFRVKPRVDVRKSIIENPLKKLVASTRTKTPQPAKSVATTPKETPPTAPAKFENPKVSAGKVRWHADFKKARAAAKISGKPVLLFQMIGRLDQRFT